MIKKFILGLLLLTTYRLSAEMIDYAAGYDDGCSSARGHFSKSSFAYENVPSYKKGWLKGKEECKVKHSKRTSHKRKHIKTKRYVKPKIQDNGLATYGCRANAWVTFSKGWDDGYRSARGRWKKIANRCPEYYRGWDEGYNHCKCEVMDECIEISATY
jgi:hypothetical protein